MKEFSTAIEQAERDKVDDKVWEFKVDDTVLRAYEATPEQVAVVLSKVGRHVTLATKAAGIIDFFMSVMDHNDAAYLSERLLDRDDPFDMKQIEGILSWLIEEWGGHPTREPSGSSSSPTNTGPSSTPEPVLSTSSTSGSTDS